MKYKFTWNNLEKEYQSLLDSGYDILTCREYVLQKQYLKSKTVVNRIDIDFSIKKTEIMLNIFKKLDIKGSFFVRLHAPEYNPFSFENYRILKRLINEGHELGYHSEIIDQGEIWNEDPKNCLIRDINVLESIFQCKIDGVASHGGMTGWNNLDFWKNHKPSEFNLLYEGYDKEPEYNLFHEAFYISDSEWTRWKCYNKGELVLGDTRSIKEHIKDGHSLIHLLVHPDTYYTNNFYE